MERNLSFYCTYKRWPLSEESLYFESNCFHVHSVKSGFVSLCPTSFLSSHSVLSYLLSYLHQRFPFYDFFSQSKFVANSSLVCTLYSYFLPVFRYQFLIKFCFLAVLSSSCITSPTFFLDLLNLSPGIKAIIDSIVYLFAVGLYDTASLAWLVTCRGLNGGVQLLTGLLTPVVDAWFENNWLKCCRQRDRNSWIISQIMKNSSWFSLLPYLLFSLLKARFQC